ncbi:MAG: GxxExxY protein [Gemmataceae bacterium]
MILIYFNPVSVLFILSKFVFVQPMEHQDLTGQIIGCAMKVHSALGPGFLESVYQIEADFAAKVGAEFGKMMDLLSVNIYPTGRTGSR